MPALRISAFLFIAALVLDGVNSEERAPVFKSMATTVKTTEHDTVLLPCYVQNQGTNKVKWWRGEELLAVNYPKAVYAQNIALFDNNTIQVSDLRLQDAGPYTCQVIREPPWGPINQTHIIAVLLPPTIKLYPEVGTLEVDQYKEVTLTCTATGSPPPLITWYFNNEEVQLLSQRDTMQILASSDKMSGEYSCTASNGVGDPATASIYLRVTYPPTVTAPKLWVHTVPGFRTEIECIVSASPKAKVEWLQDKIPVETGGRIVTYRRENRYGLVLLKTKKSDFGYYTCLASNSRGKGQQTIYVSGVPSSPVFKDSYFQRNEMNVTLAWQVDSLSPIILYNLRFREYKSGENPLNWTNLVIPADSQSSGPLHDQSYTLTGLKLASIYETSVLARNVFGWSKSSNIFRFATYGAELEAHLTTEEGVENNVINEYVSGEFVTPDSWNMNSSVKSCSSYYIFPFFLISLLHWWHEFRNN